MIIYFIILVLFKLSFFYKFQFIDTIYFPNNHKRIVYLLYDFNKFSVIMPNFIIIPITLTFVSHIFYQNEANNEQTKKF